MKLSDLDLDLRLPKPPMLLVAVMVIGAFGPLAVASAIWYKRNSYDPNPRVHLFQDMDNQARGNTQQASNVFADGRTMRPYVPGTVPYGESVHAPDPNMLRDDDLAYRGFEVSPQDGEVEGDPVWLAGYPDIVEIDADFIYRGRDQFNVYCSTCHGEDGRGVGPTAVTWGLLVDRGDTNSSPFNPANLMSVEQFGEAAYENGRLLNTITHGANTMGPIGLSIPIEDRWAIIAWVRAMQQHSVAEGQPEPDEAPQEQGGEAEPDA